MPPLASPAVFRSTLPKRLQARKTKATFRPGILSDQLIRRCEAGRGLGPPLALGIEKGPPMPAPDPNGIALGHDWPASLSVEMELWFSGNRRNRKRRAHAILKNLRAGGWCCRWCSEPVPLFRRADAVYCCTGCRKRHKRARRKVSKPI